ncbi:unnamed protein product, partial [Sphacelaria rigidula]
QRVKLQQVKAEIIKTEPFVRSSSGSSPSTTPTTSSACARIPTPTLATPAAAAAAATAAATGGRGPIPARPPNHHATGSTGQAAAAATPGGGVIGMRVEVAGSNGYGIQPRTVTNPTMGVPTTAVPGGGNGRATSVVGGTGTLLQQHQHTVVSNVRQTTPQAGAPTQPSQASRPPIDQYTGGVNVVGTVAAAAGPPRAPFPRGAPAPPRSHFPPAPAPTATTAAAAAATAAANAAAGAPRPQARPQARPPHARPHGQAPVPGAPPPAPPGSARGIPHMSHQPRGAPRAPSAGAAAAVASAAAAAAATGRGHQHQPPPRVGTPAPPRGSQGPQPIQGQQHPQHQQQPPRGYVMAGRGGMATTAGVRGIPTPASAPGTLIPASAGRGGIHYHPHPAGRGAVPTTTAMGVPRGPVPAGVRVGPGGGYTSHMGPGNGQPHGAGGRGGV